MEHVVLMPTNTLAVAYKKSQADREVASSGPSLFGQTVTTLSLWVNDLWELYGDGRSIASSMERAAFLTRAVRVQGELEPSGGMVRLLDRLVVQGVGLDELLSVVDGNRAVELTETQEHLVDIVRIYRRLLSERGLIERGEACRLIADVCPQRFDIDASRLAMPSELDRRFLDKMSDGAVLLPAHDVQIEPLPSQVELDLLFPAGPYASGQLLADYLLDVLAKGPEGGATDAARDGKDGAPDAMHGAAPDGSCRAGVATSDVPRGAGTAASDVTRDGKGAFTSDTASGAQAFAPDASSGAQAAAASAFVAVKDPKAAYDACRDRLAQAGITSAACYQLPFNETSFGRAFLALYRFKTEEKPATSLIVDFALSPFSGMSKHAAHEFDVTVRGNRLITKEECLQAFELAKGMPRYMDEMTDDLDASALSGALSDAVLAHRDWPPSFLAEQVAAIGAWRTVSEACRAAGLTLDDAVTMTELVGVDMSAGSDDCERPQVIFARQADAASYPPGSFDVVVAGDLTSAAFPVKQTDDEARQTLRAVGVDVPDEALARARQRFVRLERLARRRMACGRCLNDNDANPLYPAVVFEELLDCYRRDPSATDDLDKLYGVPEVLAGRVRTRGEGLLYENVAPSSGPQPTAETIPVAEVGDVSDGYRGLIVLPRVDGAYVVDKPCLSPSQIESYLECPYKWFAHRRLRLEGIDEGFSALEMGDFAHGVLCEFYRQFNELGHPKVTRDTLPEAQELLRACFQQKREHQSEPDERGRQRRNRLVAVDEIEERQIDELEGMLVSYLDQEVALLPTYHPVGFEYSFEAHDAVPYAGIEVMGTLDRFDADETGHVVVIDYKGAVSRQYDTFADDGTMREGKIQALIYAQMLHRALGLDVRGALYVSYGKRKTVGGAYDGALLGPAEVPGSRAKGSSFMPVEGGPQTFQEVLDAAEERVAARMEHLMAGDIDPDPLVPEVCLWCPVLSCPKRGADHVA